MADPLSGGSGGGTDVGWINVADESEAPIWYNTGNGTYVYGGSKPTTDSGSQPTGGITYTTQVDTDGSLSGVAGATVKVGSNGNVTILSRPSTSGGGGGGSTSYTTIMSGQLGANRYSTYQDASGNTWQVDNLDGSQSIIQHAPTAVASNMNDLNGDGYDDQTGLVNGAAYVGGDLYYHGIRINMDGSPMTPQQIAAADAGSGGAGPGYHYFQTADGSEAYFDPATGKTVIVSQAPPKATSSSSPAAVRLPSISGGSSSGGGGSGGGIDLSQQMHDAFSASEAQKQRDFQASQNAIDRAIQAGQYAEAQQLQRVQQQGLLAKQYADTLGSTDPNAFGAFLYANGGSIENGLRAGQDALSNAALMPGAKTLEALQALGQPAQGLPASTATGGNGAAAGAGGGAVTSPGTTTTQPPDPNALPPVPAGQTSWADMMTAAGYKPRIVADPAQVATFARNYLSNQRVQAALDSPYGQMQTAQQQRQAELMAQGFRDTGGGIAVQVPDVAAYGATPVSVGDRMAQMPGGLTGAALEVYNRTHPPGAVGSGGTVGGVASDGGFPVSPSPSPSSLPAPMPGGPSTATYPGGSYSVPVDVYGRPIPGDTLPSGVVVPSAVPGGMIPYGQDTVSTGKTFVPAIGNAEGTAPLGYAKGGLAYGLSVINDSPSGKPNGHEEAIYAPQGAQVFNHEQTQQMLGGQQGLRRALNTPAPRMGLRRYGQGTIPRYAGGTMDWSAFYNTANQPTSYSYDPTPAQPVYHYTYEPLPEQAPDPTAQYYAAQNLFNQLQAQKAVAPSPVAPAPVAPAPATAPPVAPPVASQPPVTGTTAGGITNPSAGVTGALGATGGLGTPTPQTPATPGASYGGQAGAASTGVAPLSDAALGLTDADRQYLNQVLTQRTNSDYPHLNSMAVDFGLVSPTIQNAYYAGRQTKYGVPIADQQAETARYALKGLSSGSLAGIGY